MSRLGTLWNPWREMNHLRQEMNHLMGYDGWPVSRQSVAFPAINMWENSQGLVLTAEIPGVDASKLDVTLEKDSLTLSGAREAFMAQNAPTEESYVRHERWFEPFNRTVELPFDVDPNKCDAQYEKGVLTIKLERAPEDQPKKVAIKAG